MSSLPEEGAELGRLFRTVSVVMLGTLVVGTLKADAESERLVHAFALLEGLNPVDELIAIYDSSPTKTKAPTE